MTLLSLTFYRIRVPKIRQKFLCRYFYNVDPLPIRYGGKTNITILPGSGIGPEIMECTLKVMKAAGAPLSYEILTLSATDDLAIDFENALTSLRRNRVALKVMFYNLFYISNFFANG